MLTEAERLRPRTEQDDQDLVDALAAFRPVVAEFSDVVQEVAVNEPHEVLEELLVLFRDLYERYEPSSARRDSFNESYTSFYKFIGHELFTVMIAVFMREERWNLIDSTFRMPLYLRSERRSQEKNFGELSQPIRLLDEVRNHRIRKPGSGGRISIRSDVLNEHFTDTELSKKLSLLEFCGADLLLYLRLEMVQPGSFDWIPWSALYMRELPGYLARTDWKSYAERLMKGLGVENAVNVPERINTALRGLRKMYPLASWRAPGSDHDWSKFATR